MAATCMTTALVGCGGPPLRPDGHHLGVPASASLLTTPLAPAEKDSIPTPVEGWATPPRPKVGPKLETYSVVVSQVEISELLFAMARDAKVNVDVHPSIQGKVTLNAINQTLPQILSRLARQVSLRYEFDGQNLVVSPDTAFTRHYPIDYVNMTRESRSSTSIATQIASTGRDALSSASGGSQMINNNSTTSIVNASNNRFWDTLVGNLRSMLGEATGSANGAGNTAGNSSAASAAGDGAGSGAGSASGSAPGGSGNNAFSGGPQGVSNVIASPETGMVTVRATQAQHERIREYLDRYMNSARRQVMIEATIAEVQLSEQFQQGVNWSRMKLDGTGLSFSQQPGGTSPLFTGAAPGSGPGGITFSGTAGSATAPGGATIGTSQTPSLGIFRYLNSTSSFGNIGLAVSLLQSFGKVKVLSSPKISVLNNQTAVLKVVDNRVYFTIGVQITPGSTTSAPVITYTSTPNTVPVGFVMSVTPQIEKSGNVTISVRPTISRIIGYVTDPNPALAQNNVASRIPEIQTREIESIMKVNSGDIAVMGGLMQDSVNDQQDAIPGAASVPVLGEAFRYRNDNSTKSELVVFIRPIVVHDASLEGDYRALRDLVPGPDFLNKPEARTIPRAWQSDNDAPAATVSANRPGSSTGR